MVPKEIQSDILPLDSVKVCLGFWGEGKKKRKKKIKTTHLVPFQVKVELFIISLGLE